MSTQIGNIVGFVDARESTAAASANNADQVATVQNYSDEAALDARLTAISATTYTPARLASMTHNDKVYAVRSTDDAASIGVGYDGVSGTP